MVSNLPFSALNPWASNFTPALHLSGGRVNLQSQSLMDIVRKRVQSPQDPGVP